MGPAKDKNQAEALKSGFLTWRPIYGIICKKKNVWQGCCMIVIGRERANIQVFNFGLIGQKLKESLLLEF